MNRSLLSATVLIGLIACTGTPDSPPPPPTTPAVEATPPAPVEPAVVAEKIDVNAASAELLAKATDAGPRMVHEFEEYRPYRSILQFRKEIGKYVDEAKVAEYEQHLYVPIVINDSDAATVAQLPGIDAAEAKRLVDGRPYADIPAFVAALTPMMSEAELATGRAWLRSP